MNDHTKKTINYKAILAGKGASEALLEAADKLPEEVFAEIEAELKKEESLEEHADYLKTIEEEKQKHSHKHKPHNII